MAKQHAKDDSRLPPARAMAATSDTTSSSGIRSLVPARIDRLPWSKFHSRLVIALGVASRWPLAGSAGIPLRPGGPVQDRVRAG